MKGSHDKRVAESLAHTVGFELLGRALGSDVKSALAKALAGGTVFQNFGEPLAIFRESVAASIRDIELHPRGKLFQDFLRRGPYVDSGRIPARVRRQYLSDEETAAAIRFIFSHMVNCFKGALTEMLAAAPCTRVQQQLREEGRLPSDARLYAGDAVTVIRPGGKGIAKGADFHILIERRGRDVVPSVVVAGVAEVKSYFRSEQRLREQLAKHVRRARTGLRVGGEAYPARRVTVGLGGTRRTVCIAVLPSDWQLPRTFRFKRSRHGRSLHVDPGVPPWKTDRIERMSDDEWRITLRWSKEAIAASAYEMTFWYMEKVGETIYSCGVPKEWSKMTPARAGRNAAKMMLYYAILRCRSAREEQRAIALYNSYGFGYALGMNFRNDRDRREMLWPEDLDEILASGKTKYACKIVG